MKTVDINLFGGNPFLINTKGKSYTINFVSSVMELKLMQEQEDISTKASKGKLLTQQDIERWKDILLKIIKENTDDVDDSDVSGLKPIDLLGVLMALLTYLTERSKIIYEGLSPEVKEEVEKATNDLKKKTLGAIV